LLIKICRRRINFAGTKNYGGEKEAAKAPQMRGQGEGGAGIFTP